MVLPQWPLTSLNAALRARSPRSSSTPGHQEVTRRSKFFSKENEDFQEKILSRSGLGNKTYFPTCTRRVLDG